MRHRKNFIHNDRGDAVVEAAILLPIMMMIYLALVLLAMYLPTRALLQRATQYAATALATEQSDTWLRFDDKEMKYYWVSGKDGLDNVYVSLFNSISPKKDGGEAESIISYIADESIQATPGELEVEYTVTNYVVYKEISLTATKTIPIPIDLSFIRFPTEIPVTVTSTAVVQNGDEFVRNMDIAADVAEWLDGKYNISEMFSKVGEVFSKARGFLGI